MKNLPHLPKATLSIVAITAILILALLRGINGALLATGLTIIAGLGGYITGKLKKP